MLKNEIILRIFLIAGIFLIGRPFFEIIPLFIGVPMYICHYIGLIGGALFAVYFHAIVLDKIEKSIIRQGELRTGMRWAMYILFTIVLYATCLIIVDEVVYTSPYSLKITIFTGDFIPRMGALLLFAGMIYLSYKLARYLVNQISYIGNNLPALPMQPPSAPKENNNPFRTEGMKETSHGSAILNHIRGFNEKYNNQSNQEVFSNFEQMGGYVLFPKLIRYSKHTHMITIAGSGQGKGTCAILPNLLTPPKESWVVLDVKGENAAITARFQKKCGQQVYILDPFDVQKHIEAKHDIAPIGYNPLIVAQHLGDEELVDFAAMMSEMFIAEVADTNRFFTDTARNMIKGYILHIMTNKKIEKRNLGLLYELLRLDVDGQARLWVEMKHNPVTLFASNEMSSLAGNAPETWGGVVAEARRATAFLESSIIRKSLEASDFDPMFLQKTNSTIYVILPERSLKTHKVWLRIVFGSILKLCVFTSKKRVNFLLDEFPKLGKMEEFVSAFEIGRGHKISCWVIAQSLSQLKEIYGENGMNTMLASATLKQFFGINDLYSQGYVSSLLGNTTEIIQTYNSGISSGSSKGSSTNTGYMNTGGSVSSGINLGQSQGFSESLFPRALLTSEEVGKLQQHFILMVDGEKYIFPKVPYYYPHLYNERADPNPYFGDRDEDISEETGLIRIS